MVYMYHRGDTSAPFREDVARDRHIAARPPIDVRDREDICVRPFGMAGHRV